MKESLSPILNNPYEEPNLHYDADPNGNLDYSKILKGRRPYSAHIGVAPNRPDRALFGYEDLESDDSNAPFINLIREEVKKWRSAGYPRASRVTRELLNFWFNNPERQNFQKLFFCQREAVETAIFLNEIADLDPNIGRDILRQLNVRLDICDPIKDDVEARSTADIAYWEINDSYNEEQFIVREVHFCGGNKKEFEEGFNGIASAKTKKEAETTLKLELNDEVWETLYDFRSSAIERTPGREVCARVISQLGEESSKILIIA